MKTLTTFIFTLFTGAVYSQITIGTAHTQTTIGTAITYTQWSVTTKYKPGFKYYSQDGCEVTLLEFLNYSYPDGCWVASYKKGGVTVTGYTSECWIDLETGKAIHDKKNMKIIPIDTLEKWYPDYTERVKKFKY
jgi:hypothetical protein